MRTSKPTAVKEDYLRALFRLEEKTPEAVKLVDIAGYLGLSRSTVSERVQELVAERYVRHSKYGKVTFTRRGCAIARRLTHKHRVTEVFLCDVLHVSKRDAHIEAHRLEHALSDNIIKKLGAFLGHPKVDPHGAPIPSFL